jgi:amino acid adenylation domain-containing protein
MTTKSVIHSVFEAIAAERPSGPAIRSAAGEVSYGALNEAANRLAFRLRERHGVGRGTVVGLFLTAGINYVVSLLGVAKAGGVFLPLEPATPALRQRKFLAKTSPGLVISDAEQAADWAALGHDAPLVRVDEEGGGWPASNPPLEVTGEDASYIVFTSGSTGEPKAILGSQKGLSHFVHWEVKEFGLEAGVRVSQLAPPTFDVSLRDIFVPLLAGGTLCIPAADVRANSRRLLDWLDAEGITLTHCVPSVFRGLLEVLAEEARPAERLCDMRHVLLAGEPLYGVDVERWRALMGERIELVNLYGPSETTLAKAYHRISEAPAEPGRMIPVGHPLPNTALLIIKDGELCDQGEIGEVYIKTPFMTKGYYGDPVLTDEAFVQNPLTPDVPDRVYRSGDLGRYRADRSVELLGRQDSQVKVRGIRIELSEIEQALLQHPSVGQAVVVAHSSADHQIYLTAYFIASEPLADAQLRGHLEQWLPQAMHPAFFVQMESFPVNLHGKVVRRALPRPADLLYQHQAYVAPAGAIEEALAGVWGEVLELRKIGATHTFVELGGDSLKAIRCLSRIFQRFGVEVKLQELFPRGTVRELAALIVERGPADAGGAPTEPEIAPPTEEEWQLLM